MNNFTLSNVMKIHQVSSNGFLQINSLAGYLYGKLSPIMEEKLNWFYHWSNKMNKFTKKGAFRIESFNLLKLS